jgi:hypothetical protein
MAIEPIDAASFSLATLHEAARLAHADPAQLTDLHLAHVAVYDQAQATAYAIKRDRAIERAENAAAVARYELRTKAARDDQKPVHLRPGVTAAELEALVDGIGGALPTLIRHELGDVQRRIAALEARENSLASVIKNGHVDVALDQVRPQIEAILSEKLDAATVALVACDGTLEQFDEVVAAFDDAKASLFTQLRAALEREAEFRSTLERNSSAAAVRR